MHLLDHHGTGKSYRAQMVANERDIEFIIDDGLLINGNDVIAGISAKKAPTKIETVKGALFSNEEKRKEVQKALKKLKPKSILILGTSDEMVQKIAKNLEIHPIVETIYIKDIATEEEIETAKNMRITQGKHVIPVPTFAIKKDFSGYLLDPLQVFKSKGKGQMPYMSEKSIIRPTFSYMGSFIISDSVFKQIIECVISKEKSIYKTARIMIKKPQESNDGMFIYMEVIMEYGYNISESMKSFKNKITKEIEKLTAMNVLNIEIVIKGVNFNKEDKN